MARDAISRIGKDVGQRLLHPFRSSANRPMSGLSTSEDFWALRDINFDIKSGEVVGIVGRNGAGKSTLLKILSRITEPTSGYVALKGKVNSLLEVGTGFHAELTGRENVFLNGSILGMSRQEIIRRFDQIVEFAEVGAFLDTPMKRYSSGMQVRLAFSIAAHLDSEVLIVDEVLAVGDVAFQQKCLAKMREFASGGGRTILFVSHTMSTVRDLCSRCILLKKGEIVTEGVPAEVLQSYLGEILQDQVHGNDYIVPSTASEFIRRVRLLPNVVPGGSAVAGDHNIDIEFRLENLNRCPDPVIEWSLENVDGLTLFSLRKELSEEKSFAESHDGKATICCRLTDLPVPSGQYWISCRFFPGLRERNRPLSRILGVTLGSGEDLALSFDGGAGRNLIRIAPTWTGPFLNDNPSES